MEPKTSIKQHDFISGEPRHKYFVFGDYDFSNVRLIPSTNPCGEVSLGGFQRGELATVMAPAGVGKTGIMQRLMESMREERQVVNLDYMSLYPEIQRLHHVVPEGHVTRPEDVDPNMALRDFIEMRTRERADRLREQQESMRAMDDNERFINKLTLNSFY